MNKALASFLTSCVIFGMTVTSVWATLYKFTMTDTALMSYTMYSRDVQNQNPYPLNSRKWTVHEYINNQDQVTGEYYSQNSDISDVAAIINGDWFLVEFNLWGIGGRDAAHWGETELYNPTNPTVPNDWAYNFLPVNNLSVLHFYLTTGDYSDGLSYSNQSGLTFSFVADVVDPDLEIWFGGTLNNADSSVTGKWIKYQGNLMLHGTQVPEPATLFLLGFALIGLGTLAFTRRLSK